MSHQNDEKIDVSNMSQQSEQKSDGSLATIYITKSRICQFLLGKLAKMDPPIMTQLGNLLSYQLATILECKDSEDFLPGKRTLAMTLLSRGPASSCVCFLRSTKRINCSTPCQLQECILHTLP